MPTMMSQILKSVDFAKTQKIKYLENKTLFFLQIKKFINYTSRATLWQKNCFIAEVSFKQNLVKFKYTQFINYEVKPYHIITLNSITLNGTEDANL